MYTSSAYDRTVYMPRVIVIDSLVGVVGAAVAVLHAMEHEHEHSEHEHSEHELHKWWLPFEAEKPQLADLGTWWQQFLMVAAVGVPLAIVYLCLFRQPSQLRRTFCLF